MFTENRRNNKIKNKQVAKNDVVKKHYRQEHYSCIQFLLVGELAVSLRCARGCNRRSNDKESRVIYKLYKPGEMDYRLHCIENSREKWSPKNGLRKMVPGKLVPG